VEDSIYFLSPIPKAFLVLSIMLPPVPP